jgi:hypothetical protein
MVGRLEKHGFMQMCPEIIPLIDMPGGEEKDQKIFAGN